MQSTLSVNFVNKLLCYCERKAIIIFDAFYFRFILHANWSRIKGRLWLVCAAFIYDLIFDYDFFFDHKNTFVTFQMPLKTYAKKV